MGVAIIGVGGLMKHVLAVLRAQDADIALFSERESDLGIGAGGMRVHPLDALSAPPHASRELCIAIVNAAAQRRLDAVLSAQGRRFARIVAPSAVICADAEIAEGLFVNQMGMILAGARIGRQFRCGQCSYVSHDCEIGDHVTFAGRVSCNGHVRIEDDVFVGSGAVIRDGRPGDPLVIGAGAVIGMGAVVIRSVPPGAVMVGNPARPLQRGP